MYTFISILFTLITAFMFLRMHHAHGSDTMTERVIILVGCVLFLIQAGLTYQTTNTDRNSEKRVLTLITILCTTGFATLFFWFVDFDSESIFSALLEGKG